MLLVRPWGRGSDESDGQSLGHRPDESLLLKRKRALVVVDTVVAVDMFALENIQLVSVAAVAVAFEAGGVAPASSPRTDSDTDSGPSFVGFARGF